MELFVILNTSLKDALVWMWTELINLPLWVALVIAVVVAVLLFAGLNLDKGRI
jgi:hypothetical protein